MRSDHRAIQNVFHNEGCKGIARLIDEGASHYSLRKVLRELREAGANGKADELHDLLLARGVLKERHKPSKPHPGDVKGFKIQRGNGTNFLRIPVDECFPDRDPGDKLSVAFDAGHIEVTDLASTENDDGILPSEG